MKLIFLLLISFISIAQQPTVKEAFLEKWENSRDYLVAIAEAMPETMYDFKPTERQMSFEDQLAHIQANMSWLSTSYFTDLEYDKSKKTSHTSKEATITALTNAFNASAEIIRQTSSEVLKEEVTFFAGQKSKLQILNLMQDHVSHHRGQLVVYLNLNDIEPPKYVGW